MQTRFLSEPAWMMTEIIHYLARGVITHTSLAYTSDSMQFEITNLIITRMTRWGSIGCHDTASWHILPTLVFEQASTISLNAIYNCTTRWESFLHSVPLRLRLHDDGLTRRRKSGVASSLFIPRLDKRFREEICVHTVTQKCVEFDWVCMPGG